MAASPGAEGKQGAVGAHEPRPARDAIADPVRRRRLARTPQCMAGATGAAREADELPARASSSRLGSGLPAADFGARERQRNGRDGEVRQRRARTPAQRSGLLAARGTSGRARARARRAHANPPGVRRSGYAPNDAVVTTNRRVPRPCHDEIRRRRTLRRHRRVSAGNRGRAPCSRTICRSTSGSRCRSPSARRSAGAPRSRRGMRAGTSLACAASGLLAAGVRNEGAAA